MAYAGAVISRYSYAYGMNTPQVSVVIPTHNRPALLRRALDSVFAQTFGDYEVIVVDDGDRPRAQEVIAQYADRENLVYLETKKNEGGPVARNMGIAHARGEYIAFLDDDDEWLPEKLQSQVDAFRNAPPDTSIVFSGVMAVDARGNVLYARLPGSEGVMRPFERLLKKCFIWTSALMLRRAYALQGFVFDETLKKNQEWDLELRLSEISPFYAINKPLCVLHIGESEQLGSRSNLPNIIAGYEHFLKKHEAAYHKHPQAYALRLFHVGRLYWLAGDHARARALWLRAWRLSPTTLTYPKRLFMSVFPPVYRFFDADDV